MTRQWVLGTHPASFFKSLKKNIAFCVALAVAVILVNILCVRLRTEENHYWMLLTNIVTDIFCGAFLIGYCEMVILPRWRLYRVSAQKARPIYGRVTAVDNRIARYAGLDCYEVVLDGQRRLFLPEGAVSLVIGTDVTVFVAGNMIVGVEE